MKYLLLFASVLFFASCYFPFGERIEGNGHIVTENKDVSSTNRIKSYGPFDIELVNGTTPSLTIETDENIMPYITVDNENGWLILKSREHSNLRPSHNIKIKITVSELNAITLAGSGDITSPDKLISNSKMDVKLIGAGDINLSVNTPEISSEIEGSGDISLSGETKDAFIKIVGAGNYKAEDLKTENTKIEIMGSGDAGVFADSFIKVNISGSGDVSYKGKARIEQHIAGSGSITQTQ